MYIGTSTRAYRHRYSTGTFRYMYCDRRTGRTVISRARARCGCARLPVLAMVMLLAGWLLLAAVLLSQPEIPAAARVGPCDGAHSTAQWCDASLDVDKRVASLVSALSTGEKAGLLSNTAQAVPRLSLPAYDWWNEAVHGFARVQFINGSDTHVNATSFPMSIGVSSSFNKSLWRDVGAVVGREARGAANANTYGLDALTFWAVSSHRQQTVQSFCPPVSIADCARDP